MAVGLTGTQTDVNTISRLTDQILSVGARDTPGSVGCPSSWPIVIAIGLKVTLCELRIPQAILFCFQIRSISAATGRTIANHVEACGSLYRFLRFSNINPRLSDNTAEVEGSGTGLKKVTPESAKVW